MKFRRGFILFLLVLIPITSAIPTLTLQNNETFSGETLLGVIENTNGFAKEISSDDIEFFEGRKKISIEHDVFFHNGSYYFYAYITRTGNFNLKVSNILYKEGGILKEHKIDFPFSVTDGSFFSESENKTKREILSIKPGFHFSVNSPSIKLTNKGDAILNVVFEEEEIILNPSESKDITFTPNKTFSFANFETYKSFSVPIVYLSAEGNNYVAPSDPLLKPSPGIIFANIILGDTNKQVIQLFNLGNENMTDIQISSSLAFVEFDTFQTLNAREIHNLSLEIKPDRDGFIEGELNISYIELNKTSLLRIPINLFVLPEGSSPSDFETPAGETCESVGGQVCPESCDGEASFTADGEYCCFGSCVAYEFNEEVSSGDSDGGFIWGLIILSVLGGVGYWLYRRNKKSKLPGANDKIKESVDRYSKRIKGGLER